MHHRVFASIISMTSMILRNAMSAVAFVAAILLFPATLVTAQSVGPVQRTAWGQPDLQGIWDFRTITPLERPEELGDKAFLTEEEAASLEQEVVARNIRLDNRPAERTTAAEQVDRRDDGSPGFYNNFWLDRGTSTIGTRRTSLIIDPPNGQLPTLSANGQRAADARRAYREEHPSDSWLDRSTSDRCLLGFNAGPPISPGGYNQNLQLFQTPDHVVLLTEMVHTTRVVPLDGRGPLPENIRQWSGDSRGHWEGDTLVVETSNFNDERRWRGTTRHLKLVERFTRVDRDTLEYEYTVTDSETWGRQWSASIPMRRTEVPMYEYACHEGNYSMPGILAGQRADDASR